MFKTEKTEPALKILSLGAGVQSSTMALMADQGAFGDKPDAAVFADTGWEPKPVIEHLNYLRTILSYPVYIVKKGNIKDDILTALGPGGNQFASAPFYTLNENGKKGMGRRQCTREYKITPIAKKIREIMGLVPRQRFPKDKFVEVWIGISMDEIMRMKPSRFWWQKNRWPLIEKKMSRTDCLKWYEGKGFKIPVKSACIGCPFHDDAFWLDMKNNRPDEFKEAVQFDKDMRKHNPKVKNFVHRQCVPLDQVKFKEKEKIDLFNQECEGMCGL
jgi:hypothetical protein